MTNIKHLLNAFLFFIGSATATFAQLTPCPNNTNECNLVCYGDFENLPAGADITDYTGTAYIGGPPTMESHLDDFFNSKIGHLHSTPTTVNGVLKNRFRPLTFPLMRKVCPGESGTFSFQLYSPYSTPMTVGGYFTNYSPATVLNNQDFLTYSAPGKSKHLIGEVNSQINGNFNTYTINYTNTTNESFNHLVLYVNSNQDTAVTGGAPCARVDNVKFELTALNAKFTNSRPYCSNNKLKIQVSGATCNQQQGSFFEVYATDQYGTIVSPTPLANGYGNFQSFEISPALITAGYITIKHAVWSACTPWQEAYKHINVSSISNPSAEFSISGIEHNGPQAKFTCNANQFHASSEYVVYGRMGYNEQWTYLATKQGHSVSFNSQVGDMLYRRLYKVQRRITTCRGKVKFATHYVTMGNQTWTRTTGESPKDQKINLNKELEVTTYPNPSNGIFNIKLKGAFNTMNYSVYDLSGKVIKQYQNKETTEDSFKLDLSNYAKGIYLLKLQSETEQQTLKLVKY